MFFLLSKLVDGFLTPSNLILGLGVLGFVLTLVKWRRLGLVCTGISVLALGLAGVTPLGNLVLVPLEERFAAPTITTPPTGIIMLGGAVDLYLSIARERPTLGDAADRISETAALANRFPTARVFLSGGWGENGPQGYVTETTYARQALLGMGIAASRIETEEKSRTTFENAVETKKALQPKPGETWLLVTSATHMPRSVAVFRDVGFDVIPYPVDYRTRGMQDPLNIPVMTSVGLTNWDLAAHEWVGLLAYRLSGRTKTLLPEIQ